MSESQMENYLMSLGYNIMDDNNCIDSTKVFDYASDLGYISMIDNETQEYSFEKLQ